MAIDTSQFMLPYHRLRTKQYATKDASEYKIKKHGLQENIQS